MTSGPDGEMRLSRRHIAGGQEPAHLPEEPPVRSWTSLTETDLRARLSALLPPDGPVLVLVDGRSGAGKTTVADRLARLLGGVVVHTDDISWHLHPVDWADEVLEHVVGPWRRGEPVRYRPPGWVARDRPGAVTVPVSRVLIVEGVGAGRAELARVADLAVWVQADRDEARRRGLARDVVLGRTPQEAVAYWDEWMRTEEPFLARDQPWTRAGLVVDGTPPAGGGEPRDSLRVSFRRADRARTPPPGPRP